jgi:hypothetical protein
MVRSAEVSDSGEPLEAACPNSWLRCVVSADTGPPDDTSEVGAVDWLSGPLLLLGPLCICEGSEGSEGTSDVGVGGADIACWYCGVAPSK